MQITSSDTSTKQRLRNSPESCDELISECYARSVALLKKNGSAFGIVACESSEKALSRRYVSIFGRDASICSLGMVASGDPELICSAKTGLFTLARHQTPSGQIPNFVRPHINEVDFWYLGCIDATLWWLLAVAFYDRSFPEDHFAGQLRQEIDKALLWLQAQEHQGFFLLQQNEASDWADIMPRSGFVSYTNSLWYAVKIAYNLPSALETKRYYNSLFSPFDNEVHSDRRARVIRHYVKNLQKCRDFYLSFVNFSFWGTEGDVLANVLGILAGLVNTSKAAKITDILLKNRVNTPYPVRVVQTPIEEKSPLWRLYMKRHKQNLPFQYHNGGIWPFAGCFWVILLAKMKKEELAWNDLSSIAAANSTNNWEFNEWFHGQTGKPMGMAGQSWNAAMFLLAFHVLQDETSFM